MIWPYCHLPKCEFFLSIFDNFEICRLLPQTKFVSKYLAWSSTRWMLIFGRYNGSQRSLCICKIMLSTHQRWNCGQQVAAKLSLKPRCDLSHWHDKENCRMLWWISPLFEEDSLLYASINEHGVLFNGCLKCCTNSPMSMYFVSCGVPMALHRIRTYWKK